MHRPAWLQRVSSFGRRLGFQKDWYLIIVGSMIGTVTAFGAIGYAELLHFAENLSEEGRGVLPLWLLPVLPMVGALCGSLLVFFAARQHRGNGVPQVMRAIIQRNGEIPLRSGIVKGLASIFTVGSGGSAGTEGPIVQIGATAGSVLGRFIRISPEHMRTMVGCGAAAGIASIFNAPIAGVFFVLEVLLRDFSIKVFTPIVVASVFSAATTHAFRGEDVAIFAVDTLGNGGSVATGEFDKYTFTMAELPSYIALGLFCGLIAVGFTKMLHSSEDLFKRLPGPSVFKPVYGAFVLGLLGIWSILVLHAWVGFETPGGSPAFFGNGYGTIRWLLDPSAYTGTLEGTPGTVPPMMLVFVGLLLLKLVGTSLTLGSGGSGGEFAPSLFMGAVGGAAFGQALEALHLMPEGGSPGSYALVGMAAVLAGCTHAPLTSILLLFELTRDVYVLLPIMIAAVIATVVSQLVQRDSVYTFLLRREGVLVGAAKDLTLLRNLRVSDIEPAPLPPEPVYASDPLSKLVALHAYHHVPDFAVVDEVGVNIGMVTGTDMRTALIDREAIPLLLVAELVRTDIPTVRAEDTLDTVMDKFAGHDVSSLCQVDRENKPLGLITRGRVMARYQRALEEA